MLYAIALACAPSTVSITFQFFLPTQNGRIARSQAELSMGIFPSPRNVLRYYSSQSALFCCHKICSLLLYFILYLFVIRSFDNLYLVRFHDLQCSLMTFRCYPCVSRLNTSYTGSLCCLSNRFGYRWSYSLIKCLRNDILRRKFLICDQICKCFRRC